MTMKELFDFCLSFNNELKNIKYYMKKFANDYDSESELFIYT